MTGCSEWYLPTSKYTPIHSNIQHDMYYLFRVYLLLIPCCRHKEAITWQEHMSIVLHQTFTFD